MKEQSIYNAIDAIAYSKTARFIPSFEAETYKYPETGEPNSFVVHDKTTTYKVIGSKENYKPANMKIILAYDELGKIVGCLNISVSEPFGAFKITVREFRQRQGWAGKLLDHAESIGFDMVEFMHMNTYSHNGRHAMLKWLSNKLETIKTK